MKKIYFLLAFFATGTYAQIVTVPDANFKAKLLAASTTNHIATNASGNWIKIDTNNDGQIQLSEALQVYTLHVAESNISNMTGIASFANIRELYCPLNNIGTLNLSGLVNLQYVDAYINQLTSITVNGLANLEYLDCSGNQLTSLNVTGLVNLKFLWCSSNALTALDLSVLPNLETLYVWNNQIANLDFSNLSKIKFIQCESNLLTNITLSQKNFLQELTCRHNLLTVLSLTNLPVLNRFFAQNNQLTGYTISGTPSLKMVALGGNQLTAIDTQDFPVLEYLDCGSNQLVSLDLSGNPLFKTLNCANNMLQNINIKNGMNQIDDATSWANNPLTFVCIDDSEAVAVQNLLAQDDLGGVNINTYCSFTPGGAYNTIKGNVAFDDENNGCDAGDLANSFVRLRLVDGANTSYAFTSNSGQYQFYTAQGAFTFYPDLETPAYFTVSPAVALANFPALNNTVQVQNFCVTPNGIHPDVEIVLVPIVRARPGFDAVYEIVYKNKGNQTLSGNISLTFNDAVLDYVSAIPGADNIAANALSWNYSNLRAFENRKIRFTLNVNSPQEIPAVNNGDILNFTATASPVAADETPADNVFVLNQVVFNSYDPNDKTCLEGHTVSPAKIGDYLHYTINFENIGTAEAENIVVKDMIDTAKFDVTTLQVLNASHQVATKMRGNKVEFVFENINLAANEHGNVVFKIKTKSNLPIGSAVANKADIYFDYNFPIETNTATSVFQVLGTDQFETDHSVTLSPNPASDFFVIKADSNIRSLELYDAQGRVVFTSAVSGSQSKLDISPFSKGIYFVKIMTENGMKTAKIIRE